MDETRERLVMVTAKGQSGLPRGVKSPPRIRVRRSKELFEVGLRVVEVLERRGYSDDWRVVFTDAVGAVFPSRIAAETYLDRIS